MQHDNGKTEAENLHDGPTDELFNREIPDIAS
jgi:hypothetical protein